MKSKISNNRPNLSIRTLVPTNVCSQKSGVSVQTSSRCRWLGPCNDSPIVFISKCRTCSLTPFKLFMQMFGVVYIFIFDVRYFCNLDAIQERITSYIFGSSAQLFMSFRLPVNCSLLTYHGARFWNARLEHSCSFYMYRCMNAYVYIYIVYTYIYILFGDG